MNLYPSEERIALAISRSVPSHDPRPNPHAVEFTLGADPLAFTDEECEGALTLAEDILPEPEPHSCEAEVRSIPEGPDTKPIASHLVNCFEAANEYWSLGVDRLSIQVLTYEPGAAYPLHVDMDVSSRSRKMALTVQLSDDADYEGGDLSVMVGGSRMYAQRERGTVIILPCWTPHEVAPVIRGVRKSLVATAWGGPLT